MLLRSEGLDLLVRRIPKMQLGLLDVVELTVAGTFVNRSLLGIDAVRFHVIPWLPIHASRTYSIPSEYRVWRERRGLRSTREIEDARRFASLAPGAQAN